MPNDAWLEYGTPGTSVLTPKDARRAQVRLERFLRRALRRAHAVQVEREVRVTNTYTPTIAASFATYG